MAYLAVEVFFIVLLSCTVHFRDAYGYSNIFRSKSLVELGCSIQLTPNAMGLGQETKDGTDRCKILPLRKTRMMVVGLDKFTLR